MLGGAKLTKRGLWLMLFDISMIPTPILYVTSRLRKTERRSKSPSRKWKKSAPHFIFLSHYFAVLAGHEFLERRFRVFVLFFTELQWYRVF